MKSLFPDICTDALLESKIFYTKLFGFKVLFDLDWYVQLCSPDDENLQIAFVAKDHSSVPVEYRKPPSGVFITVEVDNVDNIYKKAIDLDLTITKEICDEEWGQRHFFVVDPSGLPVDVFQVIAASPEFLKEHGLYETV